MRQAGRYLPEYRELRSYTTDFFSLVYDPVKAAEVTIQPIRRYGMDAAILFSDILVVPHALGQRVEFRAGEGPHLEPLYTPEDFKILDVKNAAKQFAPVYETVSRVRKMLSEEGFNDVALIGFCGGIWTVICYMLEGHGSRDFEAARRWALRDPESFQQLVDIVSEASIEYLCGQIEAGAEALQIFDSWAGVLDPEQFARWVIVPTKRIVDAVKARHPNVPIIGFPRGAGLQALPYAKNTGIDAIGIDYSMDLKWAAENLQPIMPVQGNLDPMRLLTGGKALDEGLDAIHAALGQGPFIFNLGHGVIKSTPLENVQQLTDIVRGWSV